MRVYAEVLPGWLGRVMYRINAQMRACAPPGVTFTDDPNAADLQILDVIGVGSMEFLRLPDYVLLQHTYLSAAPDFWSPYFERARLVMSYQDLPGLTGRADHRFHRAPWGVDPAVFVDRGRPRDVSVLTTGYDAGGEAILEFFRAAERVGGAVVHIGGAVGESPAAVVMEGISDTALVDEYNRCRYVSGLRRGEGFELPVIEGLACGARPICFDTSNYRYWFDGHAVFVPELPGSELVEVLADVIGRPPEPVSTAERSQVLARFDWRHIFAGFWQAVLR